MKAVLTPKALADAIGVSESSLRRWVDSGAIAMSRTIGGHRRIALADAVRFIRRTGATIVRPDLLGLHELATRFDPSANAPGDDQKLLAALKDGSLSRARGIVMSLYMTGTNLAAIFDGPVRFAMQEIGQLWEHAERGILVEHRATDICLQVMAELRAVVQTPTAAAPTAVGGAPSADPYLLPSTMVATILRDAGYRDENFGANTPPRLLASAAEERKAKLVWLSFSVPAGDDLRRETAALADSLHRRRVPLLVGGRHASEVFPRVPAGVQTFASMGELVAYVKGKQSR